MSHSRELGNDVVGAPFSQRWTKLGSKNLESYDSLVGSVQHPVSGEKYVIKWNRVKFENAQDVESSALFIKRSIGLYNETLGQEFIVPTSVVVSTKKDGLHLKPKVFIFQQFIDGWTGQDIPEEVRNNERVTQQWEILYPRLRDLYTTTRAVNRDLPDDQKFPVNISVGDSRRKAIQRENMTQLPSTPNILIDRNLNIKLCDFGAYGIWNNKMEDAYNSIKSTVLSMVA